MREADIQNEIRKAISPYGTYFRANVGQAWTGRDIRRIMGSIIIEQPRRFDTGLPKGFPDLFGFTDCNGVPVFTALEVKAPGGRVRPEQRHMLEFLRSRGAIAGVVHSASEALALIRQRR